jgi:hypothetical protein
MPLTGKGEKIKEAMQQQYGQKKGEEVFYASKNAGKISGVDDGRIFTQPYPGGYMTTVFPDDNQHIGFTKGEATPVEKIVNMCDALSKRLDAFEARKQQRKPVDVKPRTKDQMQPSIPHPKEVKNPAGA